MTRRPVWRRESLHDQTEWSSLMSTVEENKAFWDGQYDWEQGGEEWSAVWGCSEMEWYGTILPRIHRFVPTQTILEIAPGFGRWTCFLKDLCSELILVDLSERCIQACRERFADCSHISSFVNDGESLDMVADNSIDFIFSFDSLVHAEAPVLAAYVSQIPRKLKEDGVAFIHHSNLGEYPRQSTLQQEGDLHGRAFSMTADKMRQYAKENGLRCMSQETITWGTKRALIDCMSMMAKEGSKWTQPAQVLRNDAFMDEVRYLSKLSRLYGTSEARGEVDDVQARTVSSAP